MVMDPTPSSNTAESANLESKYGPSKISHWRIVLDQSVVTPQVVEYQYAGSGTVEDPYVVTWITDDPRNPLLFSNLKKWNLTILIAIVTLVVTFVSSAFSGGIREIVAEFDSSREVGTLGISLFVLGFAVGPLLWAPLSEIYGRQVVFILTYAIFTTFNAGAAGAQNISAILVLRFLAGAFGSSPLTNGGGIIADMFTPDQRSLAMSIFAMAPFLGPAIGPIIGGFLGQTKGWRWIQGLMAIFSGVLWITASLLIPETYAPVLLRKRAAHLSNITGKVYKSSVEIDRGTVILADIFKVALSRPWVLLFKEPIVLLLSIYMAIIYGTLYMLFAAFPIVYQQYRGWSQGIGGLSFIGVVFGTLVAFIYNLFDNKRYIKAAAAAAARGQMTAPEARLPPAITGSLALPIGMFWFAWTNSPSVHWIVSIMAGAPFGFGMCLVFLSILNYLVDAYTIYAASVLAANSVIRSLFGAAFPLFAPYMYQNLGIHWASSVPAFLALACVPMPFLFYRYGHAIRRRSHFAAAAEDFGKRMHEQRATQQQE